VSDFWLKYNDVVPVLRSYLSDDNGFINLSGASVNFVYQDKKQLNSPVTGSALVISAISGLTEYDWSSGISPGSYIGEWRVLLPGGRQMSFPNGTILSFDIVNGLY